jgi:hypothetical protein
VRSYFTLVVALGVTGCATSSYRVSDTGRLSMVDERGIGITNIRRRRRSAFQQLRIDEDSLAFLPFRDLDRSIGE